MITIKYVLAFLQYLKMLTKQVQDGQAVGVMASMNQAKRRLIHNIHRNDMQPNDYQRH